MNIDAYIENDSAQYGPCPECGTGWGPVDQTCDDCDSDSKIPPEDQTMVNVWIHRYFYGQDTLKIARTFDTRAQAATWIRATEGDLYNLSHGEHSRPEYTIIPDGHGLCSECFGESFSTDDDGVMACDNCGEKL